MKPERKSDADAAREAAPPQPAAGLRSRSWWPWAMRVLKIVFFAGVAYLLVRQLRAVHWDEVFATMRDRPKGGLLTAVALAAGSYLLYSCFDLLGRSLIRRKPPVRRVMTVNFISLAFNLNMGTLVGGIAFRYRLYSRLGLGADDITRVIGMSVLTNWLGYMLLGGLLFWWRPIALPSDWELGTLGLRALGFALFAIVVGYVLLCGASRRRSWAIRGYKLTLPPLRLALLQLLMSSVNWLLNAGVLFMLMQRQVAYPEVLGVLFASAIAGVMAHVPAGLGVLEAVFVALLSQQLPRSELLAALLMYRAFYYLAPLAVATLVYLALEASLKGDDA